MDLATTLRGDSQGQPHQDEHQARHTQMRDLAQAAKADLREQTDQLSLVNPLVQTHLVQHGQMAYQKIDGTTSSKKLTQGSCSQVRPIALLIHNDWQTSTTPTHAWQMADQPSWWIQVVRATWEETSGPKM